MSMYSTNPLFLGLLVIGILGIISFCLNIWFMRFVFKINKQVKNQEDMIYYLERISDDLKEIKNK